MTIDAYDQQHQETGSSNISKATPEWQEKLVAARAQYDGTELVLHIAYRLVNEAVAAGERWGKCANCGSPYRYSNSWSSGMACSPDCWTEYVTSVQDGWR
jgi:hypothetical protein